MSKEEAIEILSDMRCECNLFGDEEEATRYHALSWAINAMNTEPKHGRWLIYNILDYAKRPTGRKVGKCSVCGQLTPEFRRITEEPNWSYCPNCGARMDEVEHERV